jgi:hypothetical protein
MAACRPIGRCGPWLFQTATWPRSGVLDAADPARAGAAGGAARRPGFNDRASRYCWCVIDRCEAELSDGYLAGGEPVTEADVLARAALDLVTSPPLTVIVPGAVPPQVDPELLLPPPR